MSDIKEKVIEYIKELNHEIKYLTEWVDKKRNERTPETIECMVYRLNALLEVRNNLQSRLEE